MCSSAETLRLRRRALLAMLYGETTATEVAARLDRLLSHHAPARFTERPTLHQALSAADAVLITYADQVCEPGRAPLTTLGDFVADELAGLLSCVHLLPFYPATSDDGFAVSDFTGVDPGCGTWAEVERLGRDYRLMFDAVLNHVSASHPWTASMRAGQPP